MKVLTASTSALPSLPLSYELKSTVVISIRMSEQQLPTARQSSQLADISSCVRAKSTAAQTPSLISSTMVHYAKQSCSLLDCHQGKYSTQPGGKCPPVLLQALLTQMHIKLFGTSFSTSHSKMVISPVSVYLFKNTAYIILLCNINRLAYNMHLLCCHKYHFHQHHILYILRWELFSGEAMHCIHITHLPCQ